MKKSLVALLVALLITACVGASILSIGGAALLNPNGGSPSNSPAQAAQPVRMITTQQTDQVAQLQHLIAQYQAREKEYQQREQQLQNELDQANAQVQSDGEVMQQARMLLTTLQQRGLIRITDDGQIFINQ